MKIITFQGSVEDIGQQEAVFYQKSIKHFSSSSKKAALQEQLMVYRKHYPRMIQKLDAISESLKIPKEMVYSTFILIDIQLKQDSPTLVVDKGCSIFGVHNKHGCFVGRNYD